MNKFLIALSVVMAIFITESFICVSLESERLNKFESEDK